MTVINLLQTLRSGEAHGACMAVSVDHCTSAKHVWPCASLTKKQLGCHDRARCDCTATKKHPYMGNADGLTMLLFYAPQIKHMVSVPNHFLVVFPCVGTNIQR